MSERPCAITTGASIRPSAVFCLIRGVARPEDASPKRCVAALRVTPYHHAFVERKLGHLPRGAHRIKRRTRFAFADQVRMRAILLCKGVICRDHYPASHYDPVAL